MTSEDIFVEKRECFKGVNAFYNTEILGWLHQLENKRKFLVKKCMILWGVGLVLVPVSTYLFHYAQQIYVQEAENVFFKTSILCLMVILLHIMIFLVSKLLDGNSPPDLQQEEGAETYIQRVALAFDMPVEEGAETSVQNKLKGLKTKRMSFSSEIFWCSLVGWGLLMCMVYQVFGERGPHQYTKDNVSLSSITLIIFIFLSLIIFIKLCATPIMKLKSNVKQLFMEKICGFFNFQYRLRADSSSVGLFRRLNIIPEYDISSSEDQITGQYGRVHFKLVEVDLEKYRKDRKMGTKHIFRGLLLQYTFPKKFKGVTIVKKDRGVVGNVFNKKMSSCKRVALEDIRFEKIFEVYGTDQVEARYLLTSTFMEYLSNLSKAFKSKSLQLAFHGGELLIALQIKKNMFEMESLFKKNLADPSRFQQLLHEFDLIFEVVDILNLQTRSVA